MHMFDAFNKVLCQPQWVFSVTVGMIENQLSPLNATGNLSFMKTLSPSSNSNLDSS